MRRRVSWSRRARSSWSDDTRPVWPRARCLRRCGRRRRVRRRVGRSGDRIPGCSRSSIREPLLDEAAAIGAAYGSGGLLVGETLAAGLSTVGGSGSALRATSGKRLAEFADDLGIEIHVSEP